MQQANLNLMATGFLSGVVILSLVLLISGTAIAEENKVNDWKTNMVCNYNAKSNMTDPLKSGCDKLFKEVIVYVYGNSAYLISRNPQTDYSGLYFIDLNYENLIDNNFIYYEYGEPVKKSIIKYKASVGFPGRVGGICSSDKIFAYGNVLGSISVYDNNYKKILNKSLAGAIFACDISSKDTKEKLAVCAGTKINFIDVDGNLLWSKDIGDTCKNVKILDDKENVIVTTKSKLFVFSLQGAEIFSKDISIKGMDANENKAVICADDGIYVYDNGLNKIFDTADKISASNEFVAIIAKNKFIVVDFKGKEIFSYNIPNGMFIDVDSDDNYAIALTNITNPNFVIYSVRKGGLLLEEGVGDDSSKAAKISLNSGKLMEGYSTDYVRYLDVTGKEAESIIESALKSLKRMKKVGASSEEMEKTNKIIENMKTSANKKDYDKVFKLGESIEKNVLNLESNYALSAKQEADNIIALASENGLPTTTGIKLQYDKATQEYLRGEYINAKKDFDEVVKQTNQYIRDKAIEKYDDTMKKKDAMEKYGFADEDISKIADDIAAVKDHVVASVLLEKVNKFSEKVDEKYAEICKETEKAIKEATEPELFSKADVFEAENNYNEAKALWNEKDYDQSMAKLSGATKYAKNLRSIALAKDIAIILIIITIVIIVLLIILKPKVKKE